MSEQLHTPEPWPVFTDIATMMTPDPEGTPVAILSWDDYIRARACVNFCTRIDTALLEEFPGGINGLSNIAIGKQRNKLLAALEKFLAWNKRYPSSRIYSSTAISKITKDLDQIAEEADAAIASVKGSSQ